MVRKLGFLFLSTVIIFGLTRCAQTVPLTGGPEDKQPPQLIASDPDTFQTYFNTDRIRLEFDEFVEVDNIFKNLLITPVLRYQPTVIASGKKVLIKHIDDSLWENTTYVMEFNEAIQDITEHNINKGFRFVFSTGSYVDSLQIAGVIRDAFTLTPVEDAFALVYKVEEDSVPYKETPRYVGRSDENGHFRIRNMKAGRYKLFFCTDDNRNYKYDLPSEKIDFYDEMIDVLADTISRHHAYVFQEETSTQFLKGYGSIDPGSFYLVYNLPFDSLYFGPEMMDTEWLRHFKSELNEAGDSIVFWKTDTSYVVDTLKLLVHADTLSDDTLEIALEQRVKYNAINAGNNLSGINLDQGQNLELTFRFPVPYHEKQSTELWQDSTLMEAQFNWDGAGKKLTVSAGWVEGVKYLLTLDSGAFVDIHGKTNDSIALAFTVRNLTYYGTLELKLGSGAPSQGLVQLLNGKGELVIEEYLQAKASHYFPYLHPGEYRLKFISDDNGNGKWDAGNYLKKQHAEEVFIYQSPITIRSNWDQVIEWNFK